MGQVKRTLNNTQTPEMQQVEEEVASLSPEQVVLTDMEMSRRTSCQPAVPRDFGTPLQSASSQSATPLVRTPGMLPPETARLPAVTATTFANGGMTMGPMILRSVSVSPPRRRSASPLVNVRVRSPAPVQLLPATSVTMQPRSLPIPQGNNPLSQSEVITTPQTSARIGMPLKGSWMGGVPM